MFSPMEGFDVIVFFWLSPQFSQKKYNTTPFLQANHQLIQILYYRNNSNIILQKCYEQKYKEQKSMNKNPTK